MRNADSRKFCRISATSSLTASRINLRILLRVTALPTRLGTEIPILAWSPGPSTHTYPARNNLPERRFPPVSTSLNCPLPRRTPGLCTMPPTISARHSPSTYAGPSPCGLQEPCGRSWLPSWPGNRGRSVSFGYAAGMFSSSRAILLQAGNQISLLEQARSPKTSNLRQVKRYKRDNRQTRKESGRFRIFRLLSSHVCTILHQGQPPELMLISCQQTTRDPPGFTSSGHGSLWATFCEYPITN